MKNKRSKIIQLLNKSCDFMDWKKNIGRLTKFTTSDEQTFKGYLYRVDEAIWRPKRTPEKTLHFVSEDGGMTVDIRANEVNKYTLGRKIPQKQLSKLLN